MSQNSFYWHDYETFGVDPQRDRAVQFAGIRTDFDFNVIGEPLVIYCQPAEDTLPQPEACCVTGITPQLALAEGKTEAEFIALIHEQMAQPDTCTLGYNNLRFDDEVTRNLLYRNFYDPYAREWQQGNSRWDLIDLIRTMHALRPEGINWPEDDEGRISFRLEKLTAENGIAHADAHDALSDVHATIAIAKLIRQAQPKLFQFFLDNRGKHQIKTLLQLGSFTPVVHVSGMYGGDKQYLALVLPVCQDPSNSNGVIVYDLSVDPTVMLGLSAEQISARIFTPKAELPEGVDRIPLKTIHINKCPIVAPEKVLRPVDAERLNINREQCYLHRDLIQQSQDISAKLSQVFNSRKFSNESNPDPDLMIYSGGFFSATDKHVMNSIRESTAEQLANFDLPPCDARLETMLFRYRGRNFPDSFNEQEQNLWKSYCLERLGDKQKQGFLGFSTFKQAIETLKKQEGVDLQLLSHLEQYVEQLKEKLSQ